MSLVKYLKEKINGISWLSYDESGGLKIIFFKNLFRIVKVQSDKIVFDAPAYDCNPRAIAEEIIRRGLKYHMVWLSDYTLKDIPVDIPVYKKSGWKGAYHLASAKVIVMNQKGEPICYIKKKSQYQIQTLHGRCPFKLVEGEAIDKLPPLYLKRSKRDSEMTDLMLSDSKWTTSLYRRAFWFQGEVLEKGFPRNDIYFKITDEQKNIIRHQIGIKDGSKVVMYAPTFRDDGSMDCYGLDAERLLHELNKKTDEDWIFLVHSHPDLYGKPLPFFFSDTVLDVTLYRNVLELLLVTDILITDYSSIQMDFLVLNNHKPIILFAIDEEEYIAMRGIRPEYYKVPFPHCHNNDELMECVRSLDLDHPYSDDMLTWYGSKEDGHASEYVVDKILLEAPLIS